MIGYATHELAELLKQLTPSQRAAIDRIVRHVYVNNEPWADLFRGDDKVCTENTFYKRGRLDEEGEWHGRGWSHQPIFKQALELASRLALQAEEAEDLHALRRAKRRAVQSAERAVDQWIDIMQYSEQDFARIQAANEVVRLAFHGEDNDDEATGAAGDWWGAAFEDE